MPIFGAPGTGTNTIRNPLSPLAPDGPGSVRVSNQYVEVISDSGNSAVRVSNQYVEVISDSGNSKVRVSQQYLEIICTYGTPPPGNSGHAKGDPPGKIKQQQNERNYWFYDRLLADRAAGRRRFPRSQFVFTVPYVPPGREKILRKHETRTIAFDSGHTVKRN